MTASLDRHPIACSPAPLRFTVIAATFLGKVRRLVLEAGEDRIQVDAPASGSYAVGPVVGAEVAAEDIVVLSEEPAE